MPGLDDVLVALADEALTYGTVTRRDNRLVHRIATLPGRPPTVRALHEQILDRLPAVGLDA